jgi:hypothetical protein
MATKKKITREQWLLLAVEEFRKGLFAPKKYKVPYVHVSVGFPSTGRKSKTIGEHWYPEASIDKKGQVFITPALGKAMAVLEVLVHELVHAAVGPGHGHGPVFKKCALAVGLEGKMRSTHAGRELKQVITAVISKIGPYPHSELKSGWSPKKKQSTRMLKMSCDDCGYIARASLTAITAAGAVICPCNEKPMDVDMSKVKGGDDE